MSFKDLHMHTSYCDGKNPAEEMVISAIERGLDTVGVLVHSYTDFFLDASVSPDREKDFIREVNCLKEKYRDKITVLCGIEADYYTTSMADGYDYLLASVHYFKKNGKYYPVDLSAEALKEIVNEVFDGDIYAAAEEYFSLVGDLGNRFRDKNVVLIGHFDLITKFNENDVMFDTTHPRYVKAWQSAVDSLIPLGIPFELNTGAISRGYRTTPYPAEPIRSYIRKKGGSLVLSSDAHRAENVAFMFSDFEEMLLN